MGTEEKEKMVLTHLMGALSLVKSTEQTEAGLESQLPTENMESLEENMAEELVRLVQVE